MGRTLTTFTIGGVLGAAMFGGFAIASAGMPAPTEPRPAVVVDPDRAASLQASLTMSAPSAPSTASAPDVASAPSVVSAEPAPVATKSTTSTTKVVKPPVKKIVADSSADSAPSIDS